MASEPARIIWSEEALNGFRGLLYESREEILRRLALLETNPMMYQVEERGRWAGLRRFYSDNVVVFYAYWQQTHSLYVEAIVPARSEGR